MALTIKLKGKKRTLDERPPCVLPPPTAFESEPPHPTKRSRRAETRRCPVCDELVPLRLLSKHAELESERLEAIIMSVGSTEVIRDDFDNEPGPSSRVRRSAARALQTFNTRAEPSSIGQTEQTIQTVRKRRKQRFSKLRDMAKEEDDTPHSKIAKRLLTTEVTCPICSHSVRGDRDVVDAHIDACLVHDNMRREQERALLQHQQLEDDLWQDVEDSHSEFAGDIRGAGFHTRDRRQADTDEEIDIDGDDQVVFGEVQFTEGDVLPQSRGPNPNIEEEDVDIEADEASQPVDQISGWKSVSKLPSQLDEADKVELAILSMQQRGDKDGLIQAMDRKIKLLETTHLVSTSSCRICLDPYRDPAVSTGCWHTCCQECWLRCLGSTKLCPICKRITCATDLRKIYL